MTSASPPSPSLGQAASNAGSSEFSPTARHGYRHGDPVERLLSREWLVTNGLGGYASGSLGCVLTRRFHGLLIAALPAPFGRTLMLEELADSVTTSDGRSFPLSGHELLTGELVMPDALTEFWLEHGLPAWRFEGKSFALEKRVFMPRHQNTTVVSYRLADGSEPVRLTLRYGLNLRPHEGQLSARLQGDGGMTFPYRVEETAGGIVVCTPQPCPPLSIDLHAPRRGRYVELALVADRLFRIERSRGYDFHGPVFSPGAHEIELRAGEELLLVASVEAEARLVQPELTLAAERQRRRELIAGAHPALRSGLGAELVLAADQFVIRPHGRPDDEAELAQAGMQACSVIAGYHWFTDWGRDTMISLEGLTLLTGRHTEARYILGTFARHVRDGLIPNLFPEGAREGLYHTADASLWFFQALRRFEQITADTSTRQELMPKLIEIIEAHLAGTHFGIAVDPDDGLLGQGAEGYQLTWMDAKVDDWVVTPRRGKAVEINALFYNALCSLAEWLRTDGDADRAARFEQHAVRVHDAFNRRFWYEQGGYLFDVVDGPASASGERDDSAFRPNQLLSIALDFPVLDEGRWASVVDQVRERLLTPVGVRTLAATHADYKSSYDGDLRARDAAYHQGTVWVWLIGPFLSAWLKAHPDERAAALGICDGFPVLLGESCIGSISEIFDAELPFAPRGCIAQAWSVAEVARCLVMLSG